ISTIKSIAPGSITTSTDGDGIHQIREALKILAERVLILETMIGIHGEQLNRRSGVRPGYVSDQLSTLEKGMGPGPAAHSHPSPYQAF
uniref:Uncharacterized protein n=1 Tax=Denticeps clupeoides TaxID=299321 RepID=A0AAY4CCE3_9TELE